MVKFLEGVVPHGAGLGVVMRAVGVQVEEVLGGVLPDTQVPDCLSLLVVELGARHVGSLHVLVLILIFLLLAGGVLLGRVEGGGEGMGGGEGSVKGRGYPRWLTRLPSLFIFNYGVNWSMKVARKPTYRF